MTTCISRRAFYCQFFWRKFLIAYMVMLIYFNRIIPYNNHNIFSGKKCYIFFIYTKQSCIVVAFSTKNVNFVKFKILAFKLDIIE